MTAWESRVTVTSSLRPAAEYRRPLGVVPLDVQARLDAWVAGHPEVSGVHEGEFGVWEATVTERDGIRYLQAYTPDELLAKLRNLRQRSESPDDG